VTEPLSSVKATNVKTVSEEEFKKFTRDNPLMVPNGFKPVGGYIQTSYEIKGVEVGRISRDSFGTIYEVSDRHE
jgi:hypothetical protein